MTRLIIDTDPGIDDALTFLLAILSPEIKVEALTITAGNNTVVQCTYNALSLLTFYGRKDIPVFSGAPPQDSPLEGMDAHGISGLGDLRQIAPECMAHKLPAIDAIIELAERSPHEISLLCIAPLTNIAGALKRKPSIAPFFKEAVIMGGAIKLPGNNYNKTAECNIYNDAEAAHTVFTSGIPITLVPIDVTRKALLRRSQLDSILSSAVHESRACFLRDLVSPYLKKYPWCPEEDTGTLHDPLALTYFLRRPFFKSQKLHIGVEIHDKDEIGRTFVREGVPNMDVALDLDSAAFDSFFLGKLKSFCG